MVNDLGAQQTQGTLSRVRRTLAEALTQGPTFDAADVIRAGMRARAIADALEAVGLPAVLIDRRGCVLHVGAAAQAHVATHCSISAGHLVGRARKATEAIEAVINALLATSPRLEPADPANQDDFAITGLRYCDASPVQLLHGVLVFGIRDERLAVIAELLAA